MFSHFGHDIYHTAVIPCLGWHFIISWDNNTCIPSWHVTSVSSASIRRSSLRGEKSVLFKKEAKEEALHFGLLPMEDNDDVVSSLHMSYIADTALVKEEGQEIQNVELL